MKKYIEPSLEVMELMVDLRCICASFDQYNETENLIIDPDAETI